MRFVIGNDVGRPVGQPQDWPRGGIIGFLYANRQSHPLGVFGDHESTAEAVAVAYKAEAARCGGAR
jgi:hypothetical protein